ncbi:ornithine carbamoyltransferase [Aliiglaciecola sp. CAU 1673]|uniref:ornithine carbamoyltransferase n=1 Tax=Aliiglaciecola sp. CAU 1673 TaxID=3032595 RepID=UPI0023DAF53D|nr:ornithine carbamoyltransferase [Aliiglaciecola sp. CAU 1673]MDF2178687.1 ornithine carbamoyltransferase [Aliiglaciecola sp. CAU 1673]
MKEDLISFGHWQKDKLEQLLQLALKVKRSPQDYRQALSGKSVVALFEKPSLRTRVSFDIGIHMLGGHMVYMDSQAGKLAGREDAYDMGANLACWADAIVARVFKHETLELFAQAANVPVINALCERYHPCQALADFLTLFEHFGSADKIRLAYVGDGNNVSHSLMQVGAILGADVRVITPVGHSPEPSVMALAIERAVECGGKIHHSHDLADVEGANVLYTDTWLSMGDKTPLEQIKEDFAPFQLNAALMKRAGASYAMHCQPAHRELEITSELIDGPCSLLLQQAENRMHAQNAILISLLG